MRFELRQHGTTLGTRARGRELLLQLERRLLARRQDPVLLVDLRGVLVFSHSFGDELFGQLVDRIQRGRYGPGRVVLFHGANEFVGETLDRVLQARGRVAVLSDDEGRGRLIGAAPDSVERTYTALSKLQRATTAELSRRLRVSQQAVNNRLAKLLEAGAVHRHETDRGSGSPYSYRIRDTSEEREKVAT